MNKLMLRFSRRSQIKYEAQLGEKSGIVLVDTPTSDKQSVLAMVLIKALIIFLAVMGSIDCYMTGFDIAYDGMLIASAVAAISIILAFANINIILTALVYSCIIYYLSFYAEDAYETISSGITAIINMSYELIKEKYKFPSVDGFTEILIDRSTTVPTVIILGAVILGMVVALFVCNYMNLIALVLVTCMSLFAPLFFEGIPSLRSVAMLVGSWFITAMIRLTGKYHHIRFKNRMTGDYKRGRVLYSQLCDGFAMLQSLFITVLIAGLTLLLPYTMVSDAAFDTLVPRSGTKAAIDNTVRDTMIIAFSNYKNYNISSYVSSGQLGFYGNIQPDFQTDLQVTMVPYTMERTYLRNFIGSIYNYKGNHWSANKNNRYYKWDAANSTAKAIADEGVSARMKVYNVAVNMSPLYMPYYTSTEENDTYGYAQDDVMAGNLGLSSEIDVTYHPLTPALEMNLDNRYLTEEYRGYVYSAYLQVPEQLKTRLRSLCSGQGFRAEDEDLEEKLVTYFQNNFEYDLESGRLPWNTDFVEYFLFENNRGVCAHFATATTLIYRSLGIPARYVEGYSIDYPAVMSGTPKEDERVEDWLTGTSPLSSNVMTFDLSDYSAHAWVEIYKDGIGWVTVDTTPYVDEELLKEETTSKSMGEEMLDYFQSLRLKRIEYANEIGFVRDVAIYTLKMGLLILALELIIFFTMRPLVMALYRRVYAVMGKHKRTIALVYDHRVNMAVKCGLIPEAVLHRELSAALVKAGLAEEEGDTLCRLTEKALYSRKGVDKEEYRTLMRIYGRTTKLILGRVSFIKKVVAYISVFK